MDIASRYMLHFFPFFFGTILLSLQLGVPLSTLDDESFVLLGLQSLHAFAIVFGTQAPRSILRTFAEFATIALLSRMWYRCIGLNDASGAVG
jgi:hypothetical protein